MFTPGLGNPGESRTEKLIEMLNERELLAVCLHEVGHIKNYDGIKRLLIGVPLMIASQVILIQMIIKLYELGIRRQSLSLCAAFLTFFGLLLSLSPAMYLARLQEYKADTYASKFGYNKDMISALEKIEKYMESIKRKPNMISKAFSKLSSIISSHPPIQKRIENILQNDELYIAIENKNKKDLKKAITDKID